MLKTQVYRGRYVQFSTLEMSERDVGEWYPEKTFTYKDFCVGHDTGDGTVLSFPELVLGSRTSRYDSWTAWNECDR